MRRLVREREIGLRGEREGGGERGRGRERWGGGLREREGGRVRGRERLTHATPAFRVFHLWLVG